MPAGLSKEADKWYENCGLVTALHGAFVDINPGSGDLDFRKLSEQKIDESCKNAVKYGAKHVIFHSASHPFIREENYLTHCAEKSAEVYSCAAEKYGVFIHIENNYDVDAEPMLRMMDYVTSDMVGFCLYIGHAKYSNISISEWFEKLKDKLSYIHLSDNMGFFDDHLPLGSGVIDWKEVNKLYCGLNREIPITLETGNIDGVKASVKFMKENNLFGFGVDK